jgi:hypothetical protein
MEKTVSRIGILTSYLKKNSSQLFFIVNLWKSGSVAISVYQSESQLTAMRQKMTMVFMPGVSNAGVMQVPLNFGNWARLITLMGVIKENLQICV